MKIKFASGLYSKRAVMDAVRRYDKFAKFKVSESKKAYHVEISKRASELQETLPGEFSNYVLMAVKEGA